MGCLCHDEAAWEARVSEHHLTNIREMRELNNTTLTVGFRVVRKFCSLKEATFAPSVWWFDNRKSSETLTRVAFRKIQGGL
jgi:hypothetical protein